MNYIEVVLWQDAVSVDEWVFECKPELHLIQTVGMFCDENEEVLTLCLNHDMDSGAKSCLINIPKVNIKLRYKLKQKMQPLKKENPKPRKSE